MNKYWKECMEIALYECGLSATDEQLEYLVDAVDGAHENYGMAFGHDCITNPVETQAQEELRGLKRENEKKEQWLMETIPCRHCVDGTGRDVWGRDMTCSWCDGKGRVRR